MPDTTSYMTAAYVVVGLVLAGYYVSLMVRGRAARRAAAKELE